MADAPAADASDKSSKEEKKARRAALTQARAAAGGGADGAAAAAAPPYVAAAAARAARQPQQQRQAAVPPPPPSVPQLQSQSQAAPLLNVSAAVAAALAEQRASWHAAFPQRRATTEAAAATSLQLHAAFCGATLATLAAVAGSANASTLALVRGARDFAADFVVPQGSALPRELDKALQGQLDLLAAQLGAGTSTGGAASGPFLPAQLNAWRSLRATITRLNPALDDAASRALVAAAADSYVTQRVLVQAQLAEAALLHCVSAPAGVPDLVGALASGSVLVLCAGPDAAAAEAVVLAAARAADAAAADGAPAVRAIVVDSRPLRLGQALASRLSAAGVAVTLCGLGGLSQLLPSARLVLLGAAAVLGNGAVLGTVGQAAVAALARRTGVPVIACAETYKFSERVALDSLALNAVGPSAIHGALVAPEASSGSGAAADPVVIPYQDHASPGITASHVHALPLLYDLTRSVDGFFTESGFVGASLACVLVAEMARSGAEEEVEGEGEGEGQGQGDDEGEGAGEGEGGEM